MLMATDKNHKNHFKRWCYSESHWHSVDVVVGNIIFYDFRSFWYVTVSIMRKQQFFLHLFNLYFRQFTDYNY